MKEITTGAIPNVDPNCELEALIRACVQTASNRNMTKSETMQLVSQIWNTDISKSENNNTHTFPEDTPEEIIFQVKATSMLDYFNDFIYIRSSRKRDENAEKSFSLLCICAIYKYTKKSHSINYNDMMVFIQDYLTERFEYSTISIAKKYIESTIDYLFTKTNNLHFYSYFDAKKTFELEPDLKRMPFDPDTFGYPPNTRDYFLLDRLHEPYVFLKDQGYRATKLSLNIFNLIWLIETYF